MLISAAPYPPPLALHAYALDFKNGIYRDEDTLTTDITSLTGYSYTRSGAKSELNASGSKVAFAANVPGIVDDIGFWARGSLTNLFLNSAVGVTQNITVTAAQRTISFFGTGTITLSGVSTAGPLVGTGVNDRVSLTFTPSAGTLTCTVTGSCTDVSLVLGTLPGPVIVTTGASATVGADVLSLGVSIPAGDVLLFGKFVVKAIPASGSASPFTFSDGTNNNRLQMNFNSTVLSVRIVSGGVVIVGVNPVLPFVVGDIVGFVMKYEGGLWRSGYTVNGALTWVGTATAGAMPPVTQFRASNSTGGEQANCPVEFAGIRRGAFSDAAIAAILAA